MVMKNGRVRCNYKQATFPAEAAYAAKKATKKAIVPEDVKSARRSLTTARSAI
jgi:hypothetical protein